MKVHLGSEYTTLCGRTPGGKHGLPVTRTPTDATCKHCLRAFARSVTLGYCWACGATRGVKRPECGNCGAGFYPEPAPADVGCATGRAGSTAGAHRRTTTMTDEQYDDYMDQLRFRRSTLHKMRALTPALAAQVAMLREADARETVNLDWTNDPHGELLALEEAEYWDYVARHCAPDDVPGLIESATRRINNLHASRPADYRGFYYVPVE